MTGKEQLIKALSPLGIDMDSRQGLDLLTAAYAIINETLAVKVKEQADEVIARERNNAWRELREVTKSLDGDIEEYLEYGITYGDEPPRAHGLTPYYDIAMADVAHRKTIHGSDMGEIRLRQRRNVLTSSPWMDAVRPAWNPLIDVALTNPENTDG